MGGARFVLAAGAAGGALRVGLRGAARGLRALRWTGGSRSALRRPWAWRGLPRRLDRRSSERGARSHVEALGDANLDLLLEALDRAQQGRSSEQPATALRPSPARPCGRCGARNLGTWGVHHVRQLLDVEPARRDIGRHQEFTLPALKSSSARMRAFPVAVDRVGVDVVLLQLGEAVGAVLGLGEDQHLFPVVRAPGARASRLRFARRYRRTA